jgi:H+/gluconate symporter-like permease
MIGIMGLVLAFVILIVFAYKGLGALPLAMLGALVAGLSNGMNLWDVFANHFVQGYAGAFISFMLLFVSSSLYAKLMDISGCATSIGHKFVDWFGIKRVVLVGTLIIAVLSYGGVSLFVVIFAVAPVLFMMFKEANLPRHLTVICFSAGSSTFVMTCLPGSPQLSNVVPTEYLGTTLNAAPMMGIICGFVLFLMCWWYAEWATKKARERKEEWTYPENVSPDLYELKDRSKLPSAWKGFLTIIVLLTTIIVGSQMGVNSTMIAVVAMLVGSVMIVVLNLSRFKDTKWIPLFTSGMTGGVTAIGGIAAILGFGSVIRATTAYTDIINWCLSLNMNPLILGVFCTCIICGITGGSSSGQRIMFDTLASTYIESGVNLNILHRLIAIASGSLDTLPHSSGLFVVYQVLGLNHKTAYRHTFAVSVVAPLILTIVATTVCVIFGL